MRRFYLAVLCAFVLGAQERHKLSIDPATDEGKLLERIGQQQDAAQKQQLMEEFVSKYPTNPGVTWVYGQLQPMYLKEQQFDKVLAAGEAALAVDPDNADLAYNNLKAAEGKKDPEMVKAWSLRTSQNARKVITAGKNTTEEEKQQLDYSTQLDVYSEYSIYATALQATDPLVTIDLAETLEQRNPKSQYLPKVYGKYLNALRQAGQNDKAATKAEQMAAVDATSEDVLLLAADSNMQKKTEPEKVISYSNKLAELLESKQKPEGMSDADWKQKRESILGLAYWMAGVTYSTQGRYAEADRSLRSALPYLADEQLRAMGLFHLGLSDYQLGKATKEKARLQDGLKYSEQSAAIKSPVQAQAQKNVRAIRGELGTR